MGRMFSVSLTGSYFIELRRNNWPRSNDGAAVSSDGIFLVIGGNFLPNRLDVYSELQPVIIPCNQGLNRCP